MEIIWGSRPNLRQWRATVRERSPLWSSQICASDLNALHIRLNVLFPVVNKILTTRISFPSTLTDADVSLLSGLLAPLPYTSPPFHNLPHILFNSLILLSFHLSLSSGCLFAWQKHTLDLYILKKKKTNQKQGLYWSASHQAQKMVLSFATSQLSLKIDSDSLFAVGSSPVSPPSGPHPHLSQFSV